jgi:glycerol uptake facilitator-like aquaporin
MKNVFIEFVITFIVVFIVTAAVTFLYSLIVHGKGVANWETATILAIILGLLMPWTNKRKK